MLQQFRKKLQVHRSVLLGILTLCLSSLCLSSLCFSSSYIIASGSQPNVTWSVCPVNCDYTTIQAAINDTQVAAGDTIQLKANMPHTEVGILIDKNLTIEGVGTDFTVLQAADSAENATDRVLNIVDGIDVTIQKMTIRHGKSSGASIPDAGGGGIRSGSGNLSLIDVLLTDNLSHSQGGGLYNDGGDLVIHNSSIENNDSRSNGGGIYSKGSLSLINEESDARIYNNEAQGSRGGGIYHNGGAFSLSGVQVRFNRSGRGGGGLYIRAAQATIDAATISQNRSGHKNDLDDDPDCGGAGIFNSSLLAISNSTIDSNIIDKCSDNFNGHGGGILHTSELLLTIRGSEIAGNRVPIAGAGVYSTGPLHIEQSTIRINNRNGTNSYGGVGVVAKGPTLMMKEVNLHSNIDGAALHISSGTRDVVLDGVDIWQNQNPNGRGGGIKIDGYDETSNITLRNSVIRENSALMGGGIYVENGFIGEVEPFNLMIEDSGIISNSALIKSPNDTLHGQGGGLWLHGTALTMVQSLVQGNHAENHGGGMVLNGEFDLSYDTPRSRATIVNSTISGNSTLENGGGIYVDDYRPGPVLLVHATISDNIADMDGSSGTNGGGIHREGTSFDVSLHNTIIAGNRDLGPLAFTKTAPDCNGSFQTVNHDVVQGDTLLIGTLGISIFGDPTAPPPCTILGDGVQTDISLTDLELGQLADNGGDTMTHAIGANSIALRSGQAACDAYDILLDQRGYVRPDQCDIGAYEFSGVKPQPTATSTSEPEPSPIPTTTNTLVPDPTPTTEPLTTPIPSPTLTATNSPVPGSTPIPTPTATITPTAEPTPVPTTEPLATPSASLTPDASPTSSSTPLLSPTTVATIAPVGSGAETVYIPLMTN